MTNDEVTGHLQKLGWIAQIALTIPTGDLLREFSLNDTLGPLFDPTGWMAIRDNSKKNERGIRALAAFQAEVRAIWPEFEAVAKSD